ncbi:pyruvate dehydrogenase (acetyl-transferring), homodimeric type [Blastococcus sp. VKM Ac-2987]|uniref:pyruvate dehydrogenase (acetyl-transferring), homodimeric type n=1 Tax=Blastococcus sp. VKM Ac-2987 TaxID=3004141 RepID=UPI0022AB6B50|nr:pyruvate dehydrogenase (acetyl-transferring), homodimeric type [Blastococcus sp. VKM Ac-2987]MCZ2857245.1 pyruvate dehydrogenase (acetyl-transferring), homodimeric type [Blastococcus sp. VKM Ac-2987]
MSASQQPDGDPARAGQARAVITDGLPSQLVDTDPDETQEWLESLDAVVDHAGRGRARYLMLRMLQRSREQQVGVPALRSTDYINTIPPEREPWFPGDEHAERRIRAYIRWNAAIMVHRAQRPGIGVGGHISSYASSASLYEVGFNHFFRGKDHPGGGDQLYFQGHASPGIYARAFLEGRLTEHQLDGFRQEVSHPGGGLSSYPHPRLMPDFWEFPTVSMGLGPLNAIYQARFNRYLHARGVKDTSDQHVWAFLGDGEMDEPESLGVIGLAAREELDNLTFVVNCNLQRLDGPVRGNGKVIQELESFFRGAGWNVIKVIWGRGWDKLLAADRDGALVNLMNETPDGDYQTYKAEDGAFVREHFFGRDPRTRKLVEGMSDKEVWDLARGGHDYRKVYAAYKAALEHKGQPTVILAKTIKGWTLGSHFEGRNSTHQMKKLTAEDLAAFRDRLYLDIPDEALDKTLPPYYKPDPDSDEMQYMHERRRALGGAVPRRRSEFKTLKAPEDKALDVLRRGSGKQEVATTMAFVRLLKELLKDPELGSRFVPIIPDEARTFGMDSLFPTQKIYNPAGQRYTSVDRELMLTYKESEQGVILHEGINEAGSVASFTAVGTSYATHGEPMIPIYIFYSMFGFQRTGDSIWAAGDQMARGFLLGATAGRTTLNGEGLQHEDGHSLLLAHTNPAVVSYDPAFSYEVAHITRDALVRMYGEDPGAPLGGSRSPDVMYYLTVYNEPFSQPAEPEHLDVQGVLAGMYRYAEGPRADDGEPGEVKAQLLASGVAVPWALRAQELLAQDWGISADVWSVTSWTELRRQADACAEWNLLHPEEEPRTPYVTERLQDTTGPVVAVSDWMRAVPDLIAPYVPGGMATLGTDGFGLSDTRPALRRHFHVDAESIVVRALASLADEGQVDRAKVREAVEKYQVRDVQAAPAEDRSDPSPAT